MSYEVVYSYYERLESGGYDTSETKTFTKKVGKLNEDISLEKLASTIIQQLGRRDIFIDKVEVSEFVRRPVSYRESKGGIVLGNKKFRLDSTSMDLIEEDETPVVPQTSTNLVVQNQPKVPVVSNQSNKQPLKYEVFDPDYNKHPNSPSLMPQLTNLKLIKGKKYGIYDEKLAKGGEKAGTIYLVKNEENNYIWVRNIFFYFGMPQYGFADELKDESGRTLQQEAYMQATSPEETFVDSAEGYVDDIPAIPGRKGQGIPDVIRK